MKSVISHLITAEKWPSSAPVLPRLQAHRGYWQGGAQENTLEAFRAAKQMGALMFECDVQLSKDQIPVIVHDQDLKRIADNSTQVKDLTAAELFKRAKVPSLEQVLRDPNIPRSINVELKSKLAVDDPLERKVSRVVQKCNAENRLIFSSFNPMSLFRMSLHLPKVPRALLVTQQDDPDNGFILKKMLLAPLLRLHLLHLDYRDIGEEDLKKWRMRKVPISVWTVNNPDDIQKYLRWGALSVITDTL